MMPSLRLAAFLAALCVSPIAVSQEPPKALDGEKRCRSNAECEKREFCNTFPSCGPEAMGTCKKRPAVCTQDAFPAKGCDGKTYDNACRTHAAGMTIQGSR
jgi:hypothetical protein